MGRVFFCYWYVFLLFVDICFIWFFLLSVIFVVFWIFRLLHCGLNPLNLWAAECKILGYKIFDDIFLLKGFPIGLFQTSFIPIFGRLFMVRLVWQLLLLFVLSFQLFFSLLMGWFMGWVGGLFGCYWFRSWSLSRFVG
jgi:hypothetical protein